jgi:hypothetical protein
MYDRADLIETNVKPSILEGMLTCKGIKIIQLYYNILLCFIISGHSNLLQDINSMLDQLNSQTSRLQEILINKAKQRGK